MSQQEDEPILRLLKATKKPVLVLIVNTKNSLVYSRVFLFGIYNEMLYGYKKRLLQCSSDAM